MAWEEVGPRTQLLGSKEWPNNLGMGGLMETITPTEGSL